MSSTATIPEIRERIPLTFDRNDNTCPTCKGKNSLKLSYSKYNSGARCYNIRCVRCGFSSSLNRTDYEIKIVNIKRRRRFQ